MRTRPLALAGAAALLVLTGCGADLHPGSAAVIGDDKVTLSEADSFAERFCSLNRPVLEQNGSAVSMAEVRALSLHLLVRDRLAHDYVEQNDVELGAEYRQAVSRLEEEAAQFDIGAEHVPTFVEFRTAEEYAKALFLAIGLEENPGAAPEEAFNEGQVVFNEWADAQDVQLDPRFGRLDAQFSYQPGGESLSVPVSQLAQLGVAPTDPNAATSEYAASLPASQRCG